MGRRIGWAVVWLLAGCGDATTETGTGDGSSSGGSSSGGSTSGTSGTSTGEEPTGGGTEGGSTATGSTTSTGATTSTSTTSTGSTSGTTEPIDTGEASTGGASTGEVSTSSSGGDTSEGSTSTDGTESSGTTGEPPLELEPFDVVDVDAGHGHVCAALYSGKVKCWGGYNFNGDLGVGDSLPYGTMPGTMGNNLPFAELGEELLATAVTSYYHGCAIVTGDRLKCWGQGTFGALGSGGGEDLGDAPGEMGDALPFVDVGVGRTVKQVASAVWTTCAVLDDDTAKCWGWNGNGWLGQGDKNDRGDGPGEMGDNLLPIDLGAGKKVVTIGIDNSHACALLSDTTVKCWGQWADGNLGNGKPGSIGDQPGEMGDNLPALDFGAGRTVKQLAVGARHACVILDDDKVKCWGGNEYGQLGLGDTMHRGDQPGEMGDALPYVDLGTGRTAVQIAASYFHSCAILDDESLKCWGHGAFGATGQGDAQHRGDAPGEMGDALLPIDLGTDRRAIKVAPGALFNCALLDNHKVKCWGAGGEQGALGYEDMQHRGDQPGEMGDALPYVDLGG